MLIEKLSTAYMCLVYCYMASITYKINRSFLSESEIKLDYIVLIFNEIQSLKTKIWKCSSSNLFTEMRFHIKMEKVE